MQQPTATGHSRTDCATPGCSRPATTTLLAAHDSGLRCTTRRCLPCAARLACRYLNAGYAIRVNPTGQRTASSLPPAIPRRAAACKRRAPAHLSACGTDRETRPPSLRRPCRARQAAGSAIRRPAPPAPGPLSPDTPGHQPGRRPRSPAT